MHFNPIPGCLPSTSTQMYFITHLPDMGDVCFQTNPGKSSLEGNTFTEYLCPAGKSPTGKDEQIDTGLFQLLTLSSNTKNRILAHGKGVTRKQKASHSIAGFTVMKISNDNFPTPIAAPCTDFRNRASY